MTVSPLNFFKIFDHLLPIFVGKSQDELNNLIAELYWI